MCRRRPLLLYALVWFLLALVFAAILSPINVPTFVRLVRHGAKTTAQVTRPECANHNNASYSFVVGSDHYNGRDVMWMDCNSLRPGDSIAVYYDIGDPSINRATPPMDALINELVTIGLVCLTFPLAIIGWIILGKKRRMARRETL